MADQPKIVAFAGSTRQGSFNKKLVAVAADGAEAAGAAVTRIDLADYPMPIYDGDDERADGMPENAKTLRALFTASDGLLISSPEYNSGYSAVLKNTIDWISRPQPDEPPLIAFAGKVAGLMSASPGALGGLRGLVQLRMVLGNINMLVIPDQFAVSKAAQCFDDSGGMTDEDQRARAAGIGRKVTEVIGALKQ